jgi:murein DD-endopeptidase MepM/ murein hydrolase activator NlpD
MLLQGSKMRRKRHFSILIIPHNKGKIFKRRISANWLCFLCLSFLLLASVNLLFSFDLFGKIRDRAKLSQMEKENEYLESKLADLSAAVLKLKDEMTDLMEKEENVRTVFGLPEVDAQLREVGIGGPMPSQFSNNSPLVKQAQEAEVELDKLLRQARFEKESFHQIYSDLCDKKDVLDGTPSIRPTKGYLSRGFGIRMDPFTGMRQPHLGIDLATDIGTPVYATANGRVSFVGRDRGLGRTIRINHLSGYTTVYAHLSQVKVKRGDYVRRGDIVAAAGNTGYSTGPHLHYEVHLHGQPRNPLNYILSSQYLID